jgi:hypothetical protein
MVAITEEAIKVVSAVTPVRAWRGAPVITILMLISNVRVRLILLTGHLDSLQHEVVVVS